MKIQILGKGCPNCELLAQRAREAVAELGLDAQVEKITDVDKILDRGVMMTPALAIDGDVKRVGKVLAKSQIIEILKGGN